MLRSCRIAAFVFLVPYWSLRAAQATAPCLERLPAERPYTRVRLLDTVKNQTPVRAEYLIRTCGVRVPFTSELESDLRESGAGDSIIAAVRDAAPKSTAARKPEPTAESARPAKGDIKVHPKDGLRYVYIPPGSFRMGCSPGDPECKDSEKPAHPVRLTKGFWMGQTHATVEAYKKFAHANGKAMPDEPGYLDKNWNPDWIYESVPMTMVSFTDSQKYCEWVGMRLPSEAEWEYAARAGTTGPRYGELEEVAWWGGNSGDKPINADEVLKSDVQNYARKLMENGARAHNVGQKQPNAFKLFDMLGGVWQWTSDWYKKGYDGEELETDPQGPPGGELRVLRGGSWYSESTLVRASYRDRLVRPKNRDFLNGFRCVGETFVL